ncbi:hypothetical protein EJB05_09197 [Eragrostis curvula]|uniref:Uncharacterized protein n=1 Tax=Eragrostis curvula TaxID=38414 RepID=A0A5J9W4B5_9POAL|nr:hypothetical protein EJB05_09197 [Eragrostis curvula]
MGALRRRHESPTSSRVLLFRRKSKGKLQQTCPMEVERGSEKEAMEGGGGSDELLCQELPELSSQIQYRGHWSLHQEEELVDL